MFGWKPGIVQIKIPRLWMRTPLVFSYELIRVFLLLKLALSRHRQTQKAHHAAERGKSGTKRERKRGAAAIGQAEAQCGKSSACGLADQASGCYDAAGASATMR